MNNNAKSKQYKFDNYYASNEALFKYVFGRKRSQSLDYSDLTYMLNGHQWFMSNIKDKLLENKSPAEDIFSVTQALGDILLGKTSEDDFNTSIEEYRVLFLESKRNKSTFMWMNDISPTGTRWREVGTTLYSLIADSVIQLNFFLYRSISSPISSKSEAIIGFGIVRIVRLLRSMRSLMNTDSNAEILSLLRPVYELYCMISATISSDKASESIWKSTFGSERKRYQSPKQMLELAKLNEEMDIYDALYPELCSYVHHGLERLGDVVKFDVVSLESEEGEADYQLMIISFVLLLLFDSLSGWAKLRGTPARDIRFIRKRLGRALIEMFDLLTPEAENMHPLSFVVVRARAAAA